MIWEISTNLFWSFWKFAKFKKWVKMATGILSLLVKCYCITAAFTVQ